MLWLLASESKDGVFDASTEELVFRLRMTESEVIDGVKPLIDKGFFVIASGVLAERKQVAIPERERERERRDRDREREREQRERRKQLSLLARSLLTNKFGRIGYKSVKPKNSR